MTTIRRDDKSQSSFAAWARNNPKLDSKMVGIACTDLDWVWHKFKMHEDKIGHCKINHFMIIEEKSHGADTTFSQHDTLSIVHQYLNQICNCNKTRRGIKCRNDRGEIITVKFWGCHLLQYDSGNIVTSKSIYWDRKRIDITTLEKLLLFELNPYKLVNRDDRRHHASKGFPLFELELSK